MIKKIRIIVLVLTFILIVYFCWTNILLIDDNHGTYTDISEAAPSEELEDYASSSSPAPGTSLYHIHINLDNLTMYVYKGNTLIKTYPVSGGGVSTPSPLGTWKIISKDTWGEGFGGAWLGFNVPWGKYGIHGTPYPWHIGKTNSSKGCIRMLNKDVRELYRMVPHGTTVTIVYQNKPFRTMKNGDIGSDVKEVQQHLKKLGYYPGYPDGKYGRQLEKSVKKFQKDNNIWTSGKVNKTTYNKLLEKVQAFDRHEQLE